MNVETYTANGLVTATIEGNVLTITGPTGTHRVIVDERTNVEAHIAGFVAANGGGVTLGKVQRVSRVDVVVDRYDEFLHFNGRSRQAVKQGNKVIGWVLRYFSKGKNEGMSKAAARREDWWLEDMSFESADDPWQEKGVYLSVPMTAYDHDENRALAEVVSWALEA